LGEFDHFLPAPDFWPATLVFAALTALGCVALSRWDDWREWCAPTLLLLPVMILATVRAAPRGHVLEGSGLFAWPLALAAWFWLLRWRDRHARLFFEDGVHVASLWFLVFLVSLESWWQVREAHIGADAWHVVMSALPAVVALMAIVAAAKAARWPVSAFPTAYAGIGAAGLAVYLWFWVLVANVFDGSAQPLPYIPLVNPVELAQALVLGALAGWLVYLRAAPAGWRTLEAMPANWPTYFPAVFAFLTAMLLRLLHHVIGVAYRVEDLARSTTVQSALSIFWGFIALTAMVIGTRSRRRPVWFAGAGLLGVVLVKMFLVDLSRTGTVARIVSFIGVGVLMLIIGRFSPVPPASESRADPPRRDRAQEAG
jgi:uncharacterized membrane protein